MQDKEVKSTQMGKNGPLYKQHWENRTVHTTCRLHHSWDWWHWQSSFHLRTEPSPSAAGTRCGSERQVVLLSSSAKWEDSSRQSGKTFPFLDILHPMSSYKLRPTYSVLDYGPFEGSLHDSILDLEVVFNNMNCSHHQVFPRQWFKFFLWINLL